MYQCLAGSSYGEFWMGRTHFFLVDAIGYNKVRGRPFGAAELEGAITVLVDS
mgnify:CR=1 FL=1